MARDREDVEHLPSRCGKTQFARIERKSLATIGVAGFMSPWNQSDGGRRNRCKNRTYSTHECSLQAGIRES